MSPGHDVRPVGCDIFKGEQVLTTGDRIGPAEVGLLAAVGVTKVKVYQRPTVGVLSTGNEVCLCVCACTTLHTSISRW